MKKLIFTIAIGLVGMTAHAQSLPKSNNFKKVVDSLIVYQSKLIKSEFESVTDYQKRVSNVSKGVSDTLYFIDDWSNTTFDKLYDAETETFKLTQYKYLDYTFRSTPTSVIFNNNKYVTDDVAEAMSKTNKALLIGYPTISTNTYKASNSYGASVDVTETVSNKYYLAGGNFLWNGLSLDIKIPKEQAKNTTFGVMYKCVVKDPYVIQDFYHKKPTISDPKESTASEYYLYVDVVEVYIFDKTTKKIYGVLKK
jgi:ribosomal protein S17E